APWCTWTHPRTMEAEPASLIRVVVVDDHAVVRRGLRAFLNTEPAIDVVADAENGADALALLERMAVSGRLPDVVLMDLQMEPVDGIVATRHIEASICRGEI